MNENARGMQETDGAHLPGAGLGEHVTSFQNCQMNGVAVVRNKNNKRLC